MVVVDGIKYACERCIRGHRVSGCNHVEKPLTMIKKKGRPATHCNQCRKAGKPVRGGSALCSCVDSRRERTVITPKDLRALQRDYGVKVELTDGTVISPPDSGIGSDYFTPSTITSASSDSPLHSPINGSKAYAPGVPGRPPELKSPRPQPDEFNPYDSLDSYPHEGSVQIAETDRALMRPSARYGQQDEYFNVSAFQYEAGFLSQLYNADLYNSAAGNNVASAEANAGGESTAAIANVNRNQRINGPLIGILDSGAKDMAGLGRRPHMLPSALPRNNLLSTSSQDLEASMNALSPLAAAPSPRIDREELVGGILRSSTDQSPRLSTRRPELKDERDKQESADEGYPSVQAMPELSSLY